MTTTTIVKQFDLTPAFGEPIPYIVCQNERGFFFTQPAVSDPADRLCPPTDPFWDCAYPTPEFMTAEAAQLYEELMQSHSDVGEDLSLFNAPSECYPLAYDGWNSDHSEQLKWLESQTVAGFSAISSLS